MNRSQWNETSRTKSVAVDVCRSWDPGTPRDEPKLCYRAEFFANDSSKQKSVCRLRMTLAPWRVVFVCWRRTTNRRLSGCRQRPASWRRRPSSLKRARGPSLCVCMVNRVLNWWAVEVVVLRAISQWYNTVNPSTPTTPLQTILLAQLLAPTSWSNLRC